MKMNIYACGGAGANIVSRLTTYNGKPHDGFADINTYFVDTSRSNLQPTIQEGLIFIYKDKSGQPLDGNGKLRKSNPTILSDSANIEAILHKFPPGDFNVITHSGGGGTGSVSGPYLAKEMIKRGLNVVVLMIGSTISKMDTENTLKTLKTYENLADTLSAPINVLYRENTIERTRSKIDDEMEHYLYLMSVFFSGQNHGLDKSDLRNLLNYTNVTSYKPRLTAIDLFVGDARLQADALAITAATLSCENEDIIHDFMIDVQYGGVVPTAVRSELKLDINSKTLNRLHMVVFSGYFTTVVSGLQKLLTEYTSKEKRMAVGSIVGVGDEANEDGIIL